MKGLVRQIQKESLKFGEPGEVIAPYCTAQLKMRELSFAPNLDQSCIREFLQVV